MEDLRIQDPAKAEAMARAELPHHELAKAAGRVATATEAVDGHVDGHEYFLATQEYEAAGGGDLGGVSKRKIEARAEAHRADADEAGERAGIVHDTVQSVMAEPLPGSAEHLASLPEPPVVHYEMPPLPDSRGKGNLPPLPGSDQKAA